MPRLPSTSPSQLPSDIQATFDGVVCAESGLSATYSALFAHPGVASRLAELDDYLRGQVGLEPGIRLTVALTVAHERNRRDLWDSFEPLARQAGVTGAVIDGIAAGTAPRGLLPKDGIWVQFALEVLRNQTRDSTWQAVTHLVGDAGAILLAATACYYDMMARLNTAFALETG